MGLGCPDVKRGEENVEWFIPTESPTSIPSRPPSDNPTVSPTPYPTHLPTESPSCPTVACECDGTSSSGKNNEIIDFVIAFYICFVLLCIMIIVSIILCCLYTKQKRIIISMTGNSNHLVGYNNNNTHDSTHIEAKHVHSTDVNVGMARIASNEAENEHRAALSNEKLDQKIRVQNMSNEASNEQNNDDLFMDSDNDEDDEMDDLWQNPNERRDSKPVEGEIRSVTGTTSPRKRITPTTTGHGATANDANANVTNSDEDSHDHDEDDAKNDGVATTTKTGENTQLRK